MSQANDHPNVGGADSDDDGEYVELDLDAIQDAVDALADSGLDFTDNATLADHISGLTAALLRKMAAEMGLEEEQVAEAAAEIAAFAVDIAIGDDELPELAASDVTPPS